MRKILLSILLILSAFSGNVIAQTTFTVNLTSAGSGSWTVPCSVSSITVQCWGGGGAG